MNRASVIMTIVFFIVALSILFSFDWSTSPPKFNPMILFFGMVLAVIIYVIVKYAGRRGTVSADSPLLKDRQMPLVNAREIITREIVKIPCRYCGTLVEITASSCPSCSGPLR